MSEAVLDASAVLAYLQGEHGSDAVAELMPRSCISSVNVAEVVSKLLEHGLSDEAACDAMLMLPIEVIPFTAKDSCRAGLLHRRTRGRNVSLGDRACLALAAERGLPAFTTDRAWADLGLAIEIRILR